MQIQRENGANVRSPSVCNGTGGRSAPFRSSYARLHQLRPNPVRVPEYTQQACPHEHTMTHTQTLCEMDQTRIQHTTLH